MKNLIKSITLIASVLIAVIGCITIIPEKERLSEGEKCNFYDQCHKGFYCDYEGYTYTPPFTPTVVYWQGIAPLTNTCVAVGEVGDFCEEIHHCKWQSFYDNYPISSSGYGLYCDKQTKTCKQQKVEGGTCTTDVECGGYTKCGFFGRCVTRQ